MSKATPEIFALLKDRELERLLSLRQHQFGQDHQKLCPPGVKDCLNCRQCIPKTKVPAAN